MIERLIRIVNVHADQIAVVHFCNDQSPGPLEIRLRWKSLSELLREMETPAILMAQTRCWGEQVLTGFFGVWRRCTVERGGSRLGGSIRFSSFAAHHLPLLRRSLTPPHYRVQHFHEKTHKPKAIVGAKESQMDGCPAPDGDVVRALTGKAMVSAPT